MTKIELEQTIIKETQNLPYDTLSEILEIIQFKKLKTVSMDHKSSTIESHLSSLNETSLIHLENEFSNYKEIYRHDQ